MKFVLEISLVIQNLIIYCESKPEKNKSIILFCLETILESLAVSYTTVSHHQQAVMYSYHTKIHQWLMNA